MPLTPETDQDALWSGSYIFPGLDDVLLILVLVHAAATVSEALLGLDGSDLSVLAIENFGDLFESRTAVDFC